MIKRTMLVLGAVVIMIITGYVYAKSTGVSAADVRRDPPCTSHLVNGRIGMVDDTCTKLIWQKDQASSTYSWNDANNYCQNLTLGGRKDWRLPTQNELNTIIDYSAGNPALNSLLTFSDFYPDTFVSSWSATPSVYVTGRMWAVRWNDAAVSAFTTDNQFGVRCVRTNQSRFE